MRVDVWEVYHGGGEWGYAVMVDGERYDAFTSVRSLTWVEQSDVASYYQEALRAYR